MDEIAMCWAFLVASHGYKAYCIVAIYRLYTACRPDVGYVNALLSALEGRWLQALELLPKSFLKLSEVAFASMLTIGPRRSQIEWKSCNDNKKWVEIA